MVIEAVHDLSKPIEVRSAMRGTLAPSGSLIVANETARLFCGASILIYLPAGMAEQPSAATGTVMRSSTMRRYATRAGFSGIQKLEIPHPFLQFYQLRP